MQGDAGHAALLSGSGFGWEQVENQCVFDDFDCRISRDYRDKGTLDLRAGGVAARVSDPILKVAALSR